MPEIFEADAAQHSCPYMFNSGGKCQGARCMAWGWSGRTQENCETDNLIETPEGQRPEGSPPSPSGDGWLMDGPSYSKGYHRSEKDKLPKAIAQRWVRPLEQVKGYCGRIGRDNYGNSDFPF